MKHIKKLAFFESLNEQELIMLEKISIIKSYKKGEILFYEGEDSNYLHILIEGNLKIFKTNSKSQQIFLHQFSPISFVAELACFEDIPYPASSEFLTDGKVIKIDFLRFRENFLSNPDISFKIIKSLSGKLKIISDVLHCETILNSEGKVAKFIVENSNFFGNVKNVQIASILNLTPETLSRILTKFKHDKVLKFNDTNHIVFFDKESLLKIYE